MQRPNLPQDRARSHIHSAEPVSLTCKLGTSALTLKIARQGARRRGALSEEISPVTHDPVVLPAAVDSQKRGTPKRVIGWFPIYSVIAGIQGYTVGSLPPLSSASGLGGVHGSPRRVAHAKVTSSVEPANLGHEVQNLV